jgi:hypothetical protein
LYNALCNKAWKSENKLPVVLHIAQNRDWQSFVAPLLAPLSNFRSALAILIKKVQASVKGFYKTSLQQAGGV